MNAGEPKAQPPSTVARSWAAAASARDGLTDGGRPGLIHAHDWQAGFAPLWAPDTPSILVEAAFISNPDEERKLRDPRFQDQIARALLTGIRNYFIKHPPGPRGQRT